MNITEEILRAVFNATTDGVLVVDPQTGRITVHNPACVRMLGYSEDQLSVLEINRLVSTKDLQKILEQIGNCAQGLGNFHHDVVLIRENGIYIFADIVLSSVEIGGKRYALISFRDITEKKMAEEELKKAFAEAGVLRGLLPICSGCKKIRDEKNTWLPVETYVQQRTSATFTHGICPDCAKKYFPDLG